MDPPFPEGALKSPLLPILLMPRLMMGFTQVAL